MHVSMLGANHLCNLAFLASRASPFTWSPQLAIRSQAGSHDADTRLQFLACCHILHTWPVGLDQMATTVDLLMPCQLSC